MAESPPPQSSGAQSNYVRQSSTESGVDNPFRPDGDLSREADELLELLKGSGRPISEVLKSRESAVNILSHGPDSSATTANNVHSSPEHKDSASSPLLSGDAADGGKINGTGNGTSDTTELKTASPTAAPAAASATSGAGCVEVQHGIVAPVASESQVEHIVIKKKSKCHCCVIQ